MPHAAVASAGRTCAKLSDNKFLKKTRVLLQNRSVQKVTRTSYVKYCQEMKKMEKKHHLQDLTAKQKEMKQYPSKTNYTWKMLLFLVKTNVNVLQFYKLKVEP